MARYALGIDFGSLSARALIVDVDSGRICATSVSLYEHAIISDKLPDGTKIPQTFALQLPADYLNSLIACVKQLITDTGINAAEIGGIGICTTASTVLPIKQNGTPLCELDNYKSNPHAYMKMWKHRGAVSVAERMNEVAKELNESWYSAYGSVITCEWLPPKAIEIAENAPDVYDEMDAFIEVGDWLVQWMTGTRKRSSALARCNSLIREDGMPSECFYGRVCEKARYLYRDKLKSEYCEIGQIAGYLNYEKAEMLGLRAGIPVSPAIVDSEATVLSSGAHMPGDMTIIVGTSAVEILLENRCPIIKGIHISAKNAALPGLYSIGGGQSCTGDGFNWFIENCVPASYQKAADDTHETLHDYLMHLASTIKPGSAGLLALDWWNGQRSPNFEFKLTGCMIGMTLATKPEEMYRAMLEGSVYGARRVFDMLIKAGCSINQVFAGGGISQTNTLMMQIYADVLRKPIKVCECTQTGSLGSAMLGAMLMGISQEKVTDIIASKPSVVYYPSDTSAEVYEIYYQEYLRIANFFESEDSPMRRIRMLSVRESTQHPGHDVWLLGRTL